MRIHPNLWAECGLLVLIPYSSYVQYKLPVYQLTEIEIYGLGTGGGIRQAESSILVFKLYLKMRQQEFSTLPLEGVNFSLTSEVRRIR